MIGLVNSFDCTYTGTDTDFFGDTYVPDIGNIMSYATGVCRTYFTTEQYAEIRFTFENYRYNLTCGGCTVYNTRTVTNTNNDGVGSLRWAMDCANSTTGNNLIDFNIPGAPPHTINLSTPLPYLYDSGTVIDATTQPGWYKGAIVLDGSALAATTNDGIVITGSACEIYGLHITQFPREGIGVYADDAKIGAIGKGNIINGNGRLDSNGTGIWVSGCLNAEIIANDLNNNFAGVYTSNASAVTIGIAGGGNWMSGNTGNGLTIANNSFDINIVNNFIGTNQTATAASQNDFNGITILDSYDVTIGGSSATQGNIISGNETRGVLVLDASDIDIFNNHIGMDANGTSAIANGEQGVLITNSNNVQVGTDITTGNLISGNTLNGIYLAGTSSGTSIKGNIIGLDITETNEFPNYHGIVVDGVVNTTIGGSALAYNTISGNTYQGIYVYKDTDNCTIENNYIGTNSSLTGIVGNNYGIISDSTKNVIITENNIHHNNQYGTYVYEKSTNVSVSENSFYCNGGGGLFVDTDSNNNPPIPIVSSADLALIQGTSAPNAFIEIFKDDPTCSDCQGRTFVSTTIADVNGNWSITPSSTISVGDNLLVTATSGQETSRFSTCTEVFCPSVWTIPYANIPSNTYNATNELYANTPIISGSNVSFFAGDFVEMNAGFEIGTGTIFCADIQTCPTSFNSPNPSFRKIDADKKSFQLVKTTLDKIGLAKDRIIND